MINSTVHFMEGSFENFIRHQGFIIVGLLMTGLSLVKVLGIAQFSSDWLWFLAGIGLLLEGVISMIKHNKFNKKYKVIIKERR